MSKEQSAKQCELQLFVSGQKIVEKTQEQKIYLDNNADKILENNVLDRYKYLRKFEEKESHKGIGQEVIHNLYHNCHAIIEYTSVATIVFSIFTTITFIIFCYALSYSVGNFKRAKYIENYDINDIEIKLKSNRNKIRKNKTKDTKSESKEQNTISCKICNPFKYCFNCLIIIFSLISSCFRYFCKRNKTKQRNNISNIRINNNGNFTYNI